ncbi:hypothetical protein ElyMa_006458500, partial [Elysia marginata]
LGTYVCKERIPRSSRRHAYTGIEPQDLLVIQPSVYHETTGQLDSKTVITFYLWLGLPAKQMSVLNGLRNPDVAETPHHTSFLQLQPQVFGAIQSSRSGLLTYSYR